jgi:hypothetical protein
MLPYRIPATVTTALAVAFLTAGAAAAKVGPEPGEVGTGGGTQVTDTRPTPTCITTAISRSSAPSGARIALTAEVGDDYSGYPGGAAGNSNGELTAGQKGEPVGAGGTSAGSSSPFALRGASPFVAQASVFIRPPDPCVRGSSLAERRLIHHDLIQALRDGS